MKSSKSTPSLRGRARQREESLSPNDVIIPDRPIEVEEPRRLRRRSTLHVVRSPPLIANPYRASNPYRHRRLKWVVSRNISTQSHGRHVSVDIKSHPATPLASPASDSSTSHIAGLSPVERKFPFRSPSPSPIRIPHSYIHSSHPGAELTTTRLIVEVQPLWKTILLQIYLHILLCLPNFYWSRLDRVFRDAYQAASKETNVRYLSDFTYSEGFPGVWNEFVDRLVKEWETLNVVSALLLSAIFSIFGFDDDPYTRTFAMLSFVCALIGLLYGCTYIIRFGSVKRLVEARIWIKAVQEGNTQCWRYIWNEWILLSMPAVWLAWSILLFIVSLFFFIWSPKSSSSSDSRPHSLDFNLSSRILATALLAIGILYYCATLWTFRVGWDLEDELGDDELEVHAADIEKGVVRKRKGEKV